MTKEGNISEEELDEMRAMLREMQQIRTRLQEINAQWHREFCDHLVIIDDMEDYALKRALRNQTAPVVDTNEMRKNLIREWRERLQDG